jgi:hypothetical protein
MPYETASPLLNIDSLQCEAQTGLLFSFLCVGAYARPPAEENKKVACPLFGSHFGRKSFVATSANVGRFFKIPATSMTSVAAFNARSVIRPSRL